MILPPFQDIADYRRKLSVSKEDKNYDNNIHYLKNSTVHVFMVSTANCNSHTNDD